MAFDGSLIFDTQINTGNTCKELAELQQNFYDVNNAIKSQINTVKDLEQYYRELEEASRRATDPKRIEQLNKKLEQTGNDLQDARKKLIELRMQSNTLKESFNEFSTSAENVGNSLTSLGNKTLLLVRRILIFTVISRAFTSLRDLIVTSIPGIEDLKASFNELKIAIVRAAAPLLSTFIPVLQATIKYIINLVNTIRQAITAIFSLFGADIADDAEVTAKATNSLTGSIGKLGKAGKKASKDLAQFDEIMQIGSNAASDTDLDAMQKEAQIASETIKPLTALEELLAELSLFSVAGILGGKKGLGIAATIKAIGEAVNAYGDIIENGINFGNLSKNFQSDIWLLLGGTLMGGKKGAGVAAVINAVKDAVLGAQDILEKGINWGNLLLNFQSDLWALLGGYLMGGKKGAGVALTVVAIKDAVLGARDILEKGINWENLIMFLPNALVLLYKLRDLLGAKGLAADKSGSIASTGLAAVGLVAILYNLNQVLDDFKNGQVGWTTALNALALAFSAVGTALLFVNSSNPIGWILLGIGLLGTLAAAIYKNWDKVKKYFTNLKKWFEELWEGISKWFKNWWSNSFIGKQFRKVSDWFSGNSKNNVKLTTTAMTLSNTSPSSKIPALAQGAVIPPNNPYLAVVGDQKSGTNIETPLSTMVDAFKQALSEIGFGNAVMQVDGTTFARLVYRYNASESGRIGVNLLNKE